MTRATPSDYELLGVGPAVTREELQRAWEKLSELLAPGSLALYSVVEPDDEPGLLERLRGAYEAVAADLAAAEVSAAQSRERIAFAPSASPPPREPVPPPVPDVVSGPALRELREQRGIALRSVAERTRISLRQLEDIEAEAFARLPVEVYLRGFVMAYARELRLDPEAVWRGYRERWRAAQQT
jgi:hypothetical protein